MEKTPFETERNMNRAMRTKHYAITARWRPNLVPDAHYVLTQHR